MKVMVVGSGGREHALAWRLAQSPSVREVVACPGNPGMAQVGACVPKPANIAGYAHLARELGIDLTIVGPETPLVDGIVDSFLAQGLRIIGPTQAAAQLEGSKIFAKQFFQRANLLTATSYQATSFADALIQVRRFALPVVIKADGLAAGKGVVIAQTMAQAEDAVKRLGPRLVIEEFLEGEEVSFIGLSDGENLLPFAPTQDHKRLLDADRGPNTGGMGAYSDQRILSAQQTDTIMERVMLPALRQMRKEGAPFTGFLYAGLMMTPNGPQLLEFNVRLGDPEAQCLMHGFSGDLAQLLMLQGSELRDAKLNAWSEPSVCVVIAAEGYPAEPIKGRPIRGLQEAAGEGAIVFHAGTRLAGNWLESDGGRVLGVTAGGASLQVAIDNAYRAVGRIEMEGLQFRSDIGQKGLLRW